MHNLKSIILALIFAAQPFLLALSSPLPRPRRLR